MPKCYLLPCECGHQLHVETRHAGNEVSCPKCENKLQIPKFREMKNLEPVPDQTAEKSRQTRNPLKNVLFAVGVGMAGIAGLSGYLLYGYSSGLIKENAFDATAEIAAQNEALDSASVSEIWDLWETKVAGVELPEWQESNWNRYGTQGRILRNFSYGIFALAGIGLAIAIYSLILPKYKSS